MLATAALMSFGASPRSDEGHAATVTWRIHDGWWRDDATFETFLRFFDEHRLTGKIALFTGHSHAPAPLKFFEENAPLLKRRLAALRARGFRAGLNNLCTVGHADEEVDKAASVPGAALFTDWEGRVSKTCGCPNDAVWRRDYVAPLYRILASTEPDFIWTDDDFRLLGHGAAVRGCFCAGCLKRLGAKLGYTGADVTGLNAFFADPEKGEARRRGLIALNRETRSSLMATVRDAVWSVDPKIALGAMDGPSQWHNGNDWPELYRTMSPNGQETLFRPGGGCYSDVNALDYILNKANEVGLEGAWMPDAVRCCESEIESFNYQVARKSVQAHRAEVLAYLAAGARGTAYNVLPGCQTDDLGTFAARVDALEALRGAADALVAAAGTARPRGVWDGRTRDFAVGEKRGGRTGPWLKQDSWDVEGFESGFWNSDVQKAGIPAAYREEDAEVCAPSADAVWCWTKEELERRLAGGLYLSAEALEALIARGYGADVGFTLGRRFTIDACERYVEHPLTAGVTQYLRDPRQSFWGGVVHELKPLRGATVTGRCETFGGLVLAPCCAGTFVNARGGRVYASGAIPYGRLGTMPATRHVRRVFDWLAGGALAGRVDSLHRLALWVRGERLAAVFNMSLDPAEGAVLLLRGEKWSKGIRCVAGAAPVVLKGTREGACTRYALPTVAPWSVAGFVPVE